MAVSQIPGLHRLPILAERWRRTRSNPSKPQVDADAHLAMINEELAGALKRKVINGLDALRALAIILVLIEHFRLVKAPSGSLGVMIFFVLSGFLITSILLREHRSSGSISLSNFYRRRVFRIFPNFYVCWILTTIVEYFAHRFYWKTSIVSFFYMMDYGRALYSERMQPYLHLWISWSLAVEEKFYLLWPLLLLLLLKKRSTMIRTMCFIILGQWTYRAILYLGFHVRWMYCYSTFDMRADALLAGCLLAIVVEDDLTRRICCQVLRWQSLSAIPALALALMVAFPPKNPPLYLFFWSIQPLIIAVWLLQFVYWGSKSWIICGSPIVRFTARISYSLYLYHPLASQIIYQLRWPHLGYSAAVLTLLMSTLAYYGVERPFMRMRDKAARSQVSLAPL